MEPVPLRVFLNFKNQKSVFDIRYSFYTILIQISTFDIRRLCIKCFGNNECRLTNDEYRSLRRIRSERVSGLKRGSPLSAKSFYSTLFHKKDTAAIGAIFPAAVGFYKRFVQALQTPFSRILVANEDDGNETNVNQHSTFGVRHSIFKNRSLANNEFRLTNDESRSFSNGTCSIVHTSFTQFFFNGTGSIGVQALQTPFSRILVANEDDANETNVNQHSTFGVRHSIFKNNSLVNNDYRLTNDESRSFSNGTCSIVHTSFTQFFFNGTGSIGVQALQTPFSRILVANEDDGNETNVNQYSTFGVRHSIFKNRSLANNEFRLTNDESRSFSNGTCSIVHTSFTQFFFNGTGSIGVQALQTPFSRILVANEDDANETNVNQHSTFGVRHSIFKNNSLVNNDYRLTNDESRSFSNGTCSIVHTSFTQFFFNGTGSIGVQALQTPFLRILVANEDDANETNANQHSTFGVRHSIFKNRLLANNEFRLTNDEYRSFAFVGRSVNQKSKIGVRYSIFKQDLLVNNEFRLTNDEYRSFAFVKTSVNQKSKIGVRYSIFKQDLLVNNEYRLTNDESRSFSNGTCSIVHSTTKQRSYQHSPDCSGYNVELAEHYLSGKRERTFIETILYRFKKLNNYKQFRN